MRSGNGFTGDAGGEIFWQSWPAPDGAVKGVVVIAHGVSEHSGRYAHVARRLNKAGYDAFALDHHGHGRSEGGSANIGRIASAVADIGTLIAIAREESSGSKLFLLGHSMGGALALEFALERQQELDGLVLSAPAAALEAASRFELLAGRALSVVAPNLGVFPVDADHGQPRPRGGQRLRIGPAQLPPQAARPDGDRAGRGDRAFPRSAAHADPAAAGHGRHRRPPRAAGRISDGRGAEPGQPTSG